ncbi:MAG: MFS transporter [Janthinobacterium lividum]
MLLASLIGTSVEFYDFYIYATAASLVFGPLFFPARVPSAELLGAYASFGIAFLARPIGGALFGHFGDRVGRKATLVASLLLMGLSTAAIGLLPTYAMAGWWAPALLCLLRFGQGLALGGEWSGAALLALENAPEGWRARYAMFAPLGAPIGFSIANGLFLILTLTLTMEQFKDWGWRLPFLASAPLVWIGLWVRFNLLETEEFAAALKKEMPARVPLLELLRTQGGHLVAGTFGVVACFSLFYTATAFALSYGTATLGYSRATFLLVELGAIVFMAIAIVAASWLSDKMDPARVLILGCIGTIVSGILLAPMLSSGSLPVIFLFLALSLFVMGFVNGPLGAWLPSLFPPRVRYSGTSVAFNIGGILGGAFSPVISQTLVQKSGLMAVGFYLAIMGGISLIAFDVTSRRRTLGALAQSEKRYRSLFQQTHIALCEMDFSVARDLVMRICDQRSADSIASSLADPSFLATCSRLITFVDANDATLKLLGCSSQPFGIRPFDRFLGARAETALPLLVKIAQGGGRFETQARLTALDGREVTVILVIAFPDNGQAFDRVAVAMIDVTEREQAKEALLAARGELARVGRVSTVGAVSASIAHEINQPIGAMVMSAQACMRWLKRDPPDIAAASLAAERAVRDGMRASQIVQRTREQASSRARSVEPVALRQVIEDVVSLLDRELEASSTRVHTDVEDGTAIVIADMVELQQVLVNLLTNGIHAVADLPEARRELRISLGSSDPGHVRLTVRDQGRGISDEHLSKLFNPFFTTKRDGMGIGLAICKTIVEAHGGTLRGRNHEEQGAVFELVLPSADAGRQRNDRLETESADAKA